MFWVALLTCRVHRNAVDVDAQLRAAKPTAQLIFALGSLASQFARTLIFFRIVCTRNVLTNNVCQCM